MKSTLKTIMMFVLVISAIACTDDFEDINTNTNEPESVSANLLLASVTSDTPTLLARIGWFQGNLMAQLGAKNNFVDQDIYQWGTGTGWSDFYRILSGVEDIIRISRNEATRNPSYEAVGLIMKSLIYANLTDMYNAVPYTEAIQGVVDGEFTPAYDNQELIYQGILSDLESAVTLLEENVPLRGGDLIFDGNLQSWTKLANSLRLRYLLRTSKQNDVSSQMQAILQNEVLFQGNEDNAVLQYEGNSNVDAWFLSTYRIGTFDEFSLSNTAYDFMNPLNDPRLGIWYDEHPNSGAFGPMPNGLSQDNARNYDSDNDVSRFDVELFWESSTAVQAPIMKYSELQFILAEARFRNIITSGDVATYYENGIRASLAYWGATPSEITTYLAQASVDFDGTLEQIMEQKRLANFMVGMESWFDFRRTGYPMITPGPDNVNGDMVPVRYLYPGSEQALNSDNYNAAVSAIGGDNLNAKGWWETGNRY
jgi:hypothetical protein